MLLKFILSWEDTYRSNHHLVVATYKYRGKKYTLNTFIITRLAFQS